MQHRYGWLLPAIALLALTALRPGAPVADAQTPLAAAGSRVFALRLLPVPPASPGPFTQACMGKQETHLEQLTLQFLLSTTASPPTLSIAPSGFTEATLAQSDTVPLQTDGSNLRFDSVRIAVAPDQVTLSDGRMHLTSSRAGAAPDGLVLDHATVGVQTFLGDVVLSCQMDATGSGVPDTTPPAAFITDPCTGAATAGCVLLADGAVTIAFSKPVVLTEVPNLLTVTDDQGAVVTPFADATAEVTGYSLAVRGPWPLGSTLRFRLAAGVHDLAGNAYNVGTPPLVWMLSVVPDPGDLDAAANSGFETGDLSGYTVSSGSNHEDLSAVYQLDSYGFSQASPPSVVSDFNGIGPTEGAWMLADGKLMASCTGTLTVLTASFVVPAGASALVLDDDAVTTLSGRTPGTNPQQGAIISASVRGADAISRADQAWGDLDGIIFADDGTIQTGWRQLRVDVAKFAGQPVVLTLRLYPETFGGPLLRCYTSVILVDNLRFVRFE